MTSTIRRVATRASGARRLAILGRVATNTDVERSLKALVKTLANASPDPDSIPDRTILCVCTDINAAYWAELKSARLKGLTLAEPGRPADVRITARSDDLIALIEGRLNAGVAFLTGKVRVDATARDMMMLRRLF